MMAIPEEEEVTEVVHPSDKATDSAANMTDVPADGSIADKEADRDQEAASHAEEAPNPYMYSADRHPARLEEEKEEEKEDEAIVGTSADGVPQEMIENDDSLAHRSRPVSN